MLEVIRYNWDCFKSGAVYKKTRQKDQVAFEDPVDLKSRILKNMKKELMLFPFDALQVEKESKKMDWKKIKNGFDPFADILNFPKKNS